MVPIWHQTGTNLAKVDQPEAKVDQPEAKVDQPPNKASTHTKKHTTKHKQIAKVLNKKRTDLECSDGQEGTLIFWGRDD